jgi:hypothetical protein
MKKLLMLFSIAFLLTASAHSQVMVSKLFGKNSQYAQLGWGIFAYYDFPLSQPNESIRLELMDFAYYPTKNNDSNGVIGYLSIKAGYKYVFSETNAGFYIEPQAGWCRVVNANNTQTLPRDYGDGLALALEAGYSLGIGQRDNTVNFALKYESDLAGSAYTANSIGLRLSFTFHLFRRKEE